jgi:hypothetical protein
VAKGEYLVVHVLGRNGTGRTLVRAYRVRSPDLSKTPPWKVFVLENVQHVSETRSRFEVRGPTTWPTIPA